MNETGTSFSGISGKVDNTTRYAQIYGNFLLGIKFPFAFFLEYKEFSVERFASQKFKFPYYSYPRFEIGIFG